jgi:hypothetical protein
MTVSTAISALRRRSLDQLISVGPAILRDFELLGIRNMTELARSDPRRMYRQLCRLTGHPHDICVEDVFRAAVAQARNPRLPAEQCVWWYWSRKRKAQSGQA